MYVCMCNGYRDSEIREVAEQGVACAHKVYAALGNGPQCGSCLEYAQEIIDMAQSVAAVAAE
ncbi:MAG: (2Fe-2S)-binding protein [Pseudomonadota bacterium]